MVMAATLTGCLAMITAIKLQTTFYLFDFLASGYLITRLLFDFLEPFAALGIPHDDFTNTAIIQFFALILLTLWSWGRELVNEAVSFKPSGKTQLQVTGEKYQWWRSKNPYSENIPIFPEDNDHTVSERVRQTFRPTKTPGCYRSKKGFILVDCFDHVNYKDALLESEHLPQFVMVHEGSFFTIYPFTAFTDWMINNELSYLHKMLRKNPTRDGMLARITGVWLIQPQWKQIYLISIFIPALSLGFGFTQFGKLWIYFN